MYIYNYYLVLLDLENIHGLIQQEFITFLGCNYHKCPNDCLECNHVDIFEKNLNRLEVIFSEELSSEDKSSLDLLIENNNE